MSPTSRLLRLQLRVQISKAQLAALQAHHRCVVAVRRCSASVSMARSMLHRKKGWRHSPWKASPVGPSNHPSVGSTGSPTWPCSCPYPFCGLPTHWQTQSSEFWNVLVRYTKGFTCAMAVNPFLCAMTVSELHLTSISRNADVKKQPL